MKIVLITDEVKQIAKLPPTTKIISTPQKVLVSKEYSQQIKTTFIAPATTKYEIRFDLDLATFDFSNKGKLKKNNNSQAKTFDWIAGSKHTIDGFVVDGENTVYLMGALCAYTVTITQLPATNTITVPSKPMPTYRLHFINQGKAFLYNGLLKLEGMKYESTNSDKMYIEPIPRERIAELQSKLKEYEDSIEQGKSLLPRYREGTLEYNLTVSSTKLNTLQIEAIKKEMKRYE